MSGASAWNPSYLRLAAFSREGGRLRKVAWLSTGPAGLSVGVARGTGRGTTFTYRTGGGLYRSVSSTTPGGQRVSQELVANLPPMSEVRGLLQVLPVDVQPGDRLAALPFKRRFETVIVKPLNGRAAFKLGLLEPGVPQALDTIRRKEERHFHLITRTEPWILLWNVAGFETPRPHGMRAA